MRKQKTSDVREPEHELIDIKTGNNSLELVYGITSQADYDVTAKKLKTNQKHGSLEIAAITFSIAALMKTRAAFASDTDPIILAVSDVFHRSDQNSQLKKRL